ncbi:CapA family protein [Streptomyces sp. DSM 42041]|uniref:CapA family protein n=1 Tax=Streptomyces hazeniae TaxID=3075538 RepID=A0ABU2NXW0_9ACTN|nr:CapA family protein [Streptomyces sp. DSM 42041]MDT0381456.1 CapA family protein [Streptomyces sp. DSM 42041]
MGRIRRPVRLAGVLTLCAALASCSQTQTGTDAAAGDRDEQRIPAARAADAEPFTLVASGDVIPYPSIMRQARQDAGGEGYDFTRIFAGIRPVVAQADLALCHMETPYGDDDGPFTGYPLFRSPPQLAESLRATGYDSCSTASNHTLDAGMEGLTRTLRAMDEAGLEHAGSARSSRERNSPTLLKAGRATVAHLSYTYGTNGIPVPDGKPWAVNLLDPRKVVADARAARKAGADVVVASVHWGTEWQQKPDARQLRLAKRLTASRSDGRRDIDLILGTHNHVPQAYEKVNGTWVVYGLGDQVASFIPSMYRGNEGSTARFTFTPPERAGEPWTVSEAGFLVTHSDTGPPFRVVRATEDRFPEVRQRVREAVLSRGAADDGLTETR